MSRRQMLDSMRHGSHDYTNSLDLDYLDTPNRLSSNSSTNSHMQLADSGRDVLKDTKDAVGGARSPYAMKPVELSGAIYSPTRDRSNTVPYNHIRSEEAVRGGVLDDDVSVASPELSPQTARPGGMSLFVSSLETNDTKGAERPPTDSSASDLVGHMAAFKFGSSDPDGIGEKSSSCVQSLPTPVSAKETDLRELHTPFHVTDPQSYRHRPNKRSTSEETNNPAEDEAAQRRTTATPASTRGVMDAATALMLEKSADRGAPLVTTTGGTGMYQSERDCGDSIMRVETSLAELQVALAKEKHSNIDAEQRISALMREVDVLRAENMALASACPANSPAMDASQVHPSVASKKYVEDLEARVARLSKSLESKERDLEARDERIRLLEHKLADQLLSGSVGTTMAYKHSPSSQLMTRMHSGNSISRSTAEIPVTVAPRLLSTVVPSVHVNAVTFSDLKTYSSQETRKSPVPQVRTLSGNSHLERTASLGRQRGPERSTDRDSSPQPRLIPGEEEYKPPSGGGTRLTAVGATTMAVGLTPPVAAKLSTALRRNSSTRRGDTTASERPHSATRVPSVPRKPSISSARKRGGPLRAPSLNESSLLSHGGGAAVAGGIASGKRMNSNASSAMGPRPVSPRKRGGTPMRQGSQSRMLLDQQQPSSRAGSRKASTSSSVAPYGPGDDSHPARRTSTPQKGSTPGSRKGSTVSATRRSSGTAAHPIHLQRAPNNAMEHPPPQLQKHIANLYSMSPPRSVTPSMHSVISAARSRPQISYNARDDTSVMKGTTTTVVFRSKPNPAVGPYYSENPIVAPKADAVVPLPHDDPFVSEKYTTTYYPNRLVRTNRSAGRSSVEGDADTEEDREVSV